jgi:hypothetical protein
MIRNQNLSLNIIFKTNDELLYKEAVLQILKFEKDIIYNEKNNLLQTKYILYIYLFQIFKELKLIPKESIYFRRKFNIPKINNHLKSLIHFKWNLYKYSNNEFRNSFIFEKIIKFIDTLILYIFLQ